MTKTILESLNNNSIGNNLAQLENQVRICQNEASKFSKVLEGRYASLLQVWPFVTSLDFESEVQPQFTAIFAHIHQLVTNIRIPSEVAWPKKVLRSAKRCFLQFQEQQSFILRPIKADCLREKSMEQIWHYLKCHPYATSWALLDQDRKILWQFCASLHHQEDNWTFLEHICSGKYTRNRKIYHYKLSAPEEETKILRLGWFKKDYLLSTKVLSLFIKNE